MSNIYKNRIIPTLLCCVALTGCEKVSPASEAGRAFIEHFCHWDYTEALKLSSGFAHRVMTNGLEHEQSSKEKFAQQKLKCKIKSITTAFNDDYTKAKYYVWMDRLEPKEKPMQDITTAWEVQLERTDENEWKVYDFEWGRSSSELIDLGF